MEWMGEVLTICFVAETMLVHRANTTRVRETIVKSLYEKYHLKYNPSKKEKVG
jgi:hypothetical protein